MSDVDWVQRGISADAERLAFEDLSDERVRQATIYTRQDVMFLCRLLKRANGTLRWIAFLLLIITFKLIFF